MRISIKRDRPSNQLKNNLCSTALFTKYRAMTYCGRPSFSNLANNMWASKTCQVLFWPTFQVFFCAGEVERKVGGSSDVEELARGQGTLTANLWPRCLKKTPVCVWKRSSQLLVIRGKHLISPPPSPWDGDKSAVSVCPPYMRLATNCFFYSTLPFPFLFSHPSPCSHTHTTHCIPTFKCKIKLLAFLSPL